MFLLLLHLVAFLFETGRLVNQLIAERERERGYLRMAGLRY